ncbi:MAG: hypothetical protein CML42_10095 [Rhodobacteraceae bacterium]|nr:hypothetical protein [Paracoccaceae bacterium]
MTSITQTIPSLTGGISQQPDQLMLPGTVKHLHNFIPDITEGLVKRPGSQLVKALTGATSTGCWFSYYRDQSEGAYIGQVQRNGSVNIWKASDGTAQLVTGNVSGYLTHSDITDLKFLTVADTTFVTNTTKVVAQTSDISVKPGPSIGRGNAGNHYQTFIELRQVSHGRAYSFDVASATATEEYTSGYSDRGPASRVSLGTEAQSPYYQVNRVDDITDHAGKVLSINRNTGGTAYKGLDPQLPFQGSEIVACSGGSGSGMIVRLTNVGQVNLSKYAGSTINGDEYVGLYNTSVELLFGGDGYKTTQTNGNPSFVTAVLKGVTYKIFIEEVQPIKTKLDLGTFRPAPTSFDGNNVISADTILDIDKANSDLTPTIEKIGNGFMLSHEFPFNVTTSEPDLWRITTTEVNDVSELPRQCKNGMIVKVANSSDSQEDDFYLKFEGNEGLDGPGKWAETIAPSVGRGSIDANGTPSANYIAPVNVHTTFNQETLPIKIQRTVDQSNNIVFHASYITWEQRKVGDDTTNPFPTFLGEKISQTFYHRNRLGFLCEDNVILSQADDLFNFFNNTALVVSGNDPIDITSSSTQPTRFVDCIETNTGLVIFGETQQFMLHTDSDSLTPDTAKLSNISTYRYSPETTPISLGTTIGFLDAAGAYSRFFEMFDIKREGEPQLVDVTKVAPKLLPNTIDILSISRENSMIFFSTKGDEHMYLYRYFNTGSERLQGAWCEWTFPFNIAYTFVLDDDLYLVSTTNELCVLNLRNVINDTTLIGIQDPNDLFINLTYNRAGSLQSYKVHLDCMEFVTAGSYNSADNTTAVSWPNHVPHIFDNLNPFAVDSSTGEVFIYKSNSGDNFVFHGNFAGNQIIIGYPMGSYLELPKIYVSKTAGNKTTTDVTASLTLQRIHYHFGQISEIEFLYTAPGTIAADAADPGSALYLQQMFSNPSNLYKSDKIVAESDITLTQTIYQRNYNMNHFLFSYHPGPCTLHSLTWEGDYTPKFHKRV